MKTIHRLFRRTALPLSLLGFSLAGCATVPQHGGFKSVSKVARQRIGALIMWNQNEKAQKKINAAVGRLLAHRLTPAAAVQIALLNNPSLQERYEQLGMSEAQLIKAGLLENPVFTFDYRFPASPYNGWDASIAQNFLDLLLLPSRKKQAAAQFAATKAEVSQSVLMLAEKTRRAFYRAVGDAQIVALGENIEKGQSAALTLARKLRQAGNTPPLAYDQDLSLYEHVRLQVAMDEAAFLEDRQRLFTLMGLWGAQGHARLPHRLPLPQHDISLAGLESRAVSQNLRLEAANKRLAAFAAVVKVSGLAGILPGASIGVNYVRDPDVRGTLGPAISVPLPIFNQGQPAAAMAISEYRAAYRHYQAVAIEVRAQVRERWVALHALAREVIFYQKIMLPLRRRIVDETQASYNGMFDSGFLLVESKIDEIKTARRFVISLERYWRARAKLQNTVGGHLSDQRPPQAPIETSHSTQEKTP